MTILLGQIELLTIGAVLALLVLAVVSYNLIRLRRVEQVLDRLAKPPSPACLRCAAYRGLNVQH